MLEVLLGLGLIGVLFALAYAASTLALETLLLAGALIALGGLALCVPAGLGYHVFMRRGLAEHGAVPPGWYWSPTRYHHVLSPGAFRAVLPFIVCGVTGVLMAFLGCALALVWVLRL
jgi:hypothetical protein